MKIVSYLQAKNESQNGNLRRCLTNITKVTSPDLVVVYDDGSTDDSHEIYKEFGVNVIRGPGNEFENELFIKQKLLDYCRDTLKGDWIFWIDADCVLNGNGTDRGGIQELVNRGESEGVNGWYCHWLNTYLHPRWYRTDQKFNDFGQLNIYKILPGVNIGCRPGLHQRQTPLVGTESHQDLVDVIHLGFASPEAIRQKYLQYWRVGQRGWDLERLISMADLKLEQIPDDWMPDHYRPDDPGKPAPYSFDALREKFPALGLDERWMLDEYRKHD